MAGSEFAGQDVHHHAWHSLGSDVDKHWDGGGVVLEVPADWHSWQNSHLLALGHYLYCHETNVSAIMKNKNYIH